jgi:hypothetical protein
VNITSLTGPVNLDNRSLTAFLSLSLIIAIIAPPHSKLTII